ncbi:hypothetical protein GN244_ATG20227 [Phytophthora infestans]|uniref:Uncharacterized protein n=1 Tax=Phytophthora infestans TaxID=4787 RepID=A0A833SP47_PHYIN|nr:hypothetical protein GN244_ATG20227 [Phytophthora infestans]
MPANKDTYAYSYDTLGKIHFRCKQGGSERKQLPNSGYSNLMAHLTLKHEDFKSQYGASLSSNAGRHQDYGFVSEETSYRFQWMCWAVDRIMSLS